MSSMTTSAYLNFGGLALKHICEVPWADDEGYLVHLGSLVRGEAVEFSDELLADKPEDRKRVRKLVDRSWIASKLEGPGHSFCES